LKEKMVADCETSYVRLSTLAGRLLY